jgi:ectoine hydroxylase-related dioxygenase (phytanoyl-CoA dioxygenase family)
MHECKAYELETLRAEVTALHARLSASELEMRLADRDREYRRRLQSLDKAAAGVEAGATAGDAYFSRLLAQVRATVAEMHSQGYVVVPDLLMREQVTRVRDKLEPFFAATRRLFGGLDPQNARQTVHIQNVLAKTRAADEVAVNPQLRAIIGAILGHDFILNAGAIAMSPDPGCSPQGLHRDDGAYALLPRPRMPLVVTAAIALDDFTKENGGTQVAPGSCCWPAARLPQPDEVIQVEMRAGSALLWDGSIFHGGGANATKDRTRRTLTLNYARGWLRTQFNQYLSIPRDLVLSMPPELQRDLGYQRSARGLGGCDNQDPLDYLRRMASFGGDGAQRLLGQEEEPAPLGR